MPKLKLKKAYFAYFADILLTLSFGCQMPVVEIITHVNLHITLTGFVILLQTLPIHTKTIYIKASKTELWCN